MRAEVVDQSLRSGTLSSVRPEQWGLTLGSYPDGSGSGWAVGVGHTAALAVAADAGEGAGASAAGGSPWELPNLYEVSLQFNLGGGLSLTPGMLLVRQAAESVAYLGLKSAWTF